MQTYLGLGSNLGDRLANMQRAVDLLKKTTGKAVAVSSVYECDALYNASMPRFLNAIFVVDTELSPRELLKKIQEIEKEIGRGTDQQGRTAPRVIDIDILFYGGEMVEEKDLVIPHARMVERLFVLLPLDELNPGIEINGKRISSVSKRLMKANPAYRIEKTNFKLEY